VIGRTISVLHDFLIFSPELLAVNLEQKTKQKDANWTQQLHKLMPRRFADQNVPVLKALQRAASLEAETTPKQHPNTTQTTTTKAQE
jgi:hypothetical protein